MLLDSDSSLKVAHDIIHDANDLLRIKDSIAEMKAGEQRKHSKWEQLLDTPDSPNLPPDSTVPEGYVEFEYSDGSIFRVPCVWNIFMFSEKDVREKITFINGEHSGQWRVGTATTSVGAFYGLISDAPIEVGTLTTDGLISLNNEDYGDVLSIVFPQIEELSTGTIDALALTIQEFTGTNTTLGNCTFNDVSAPDAEVEDVVSARFDEIKATELICTGEQRITVESFNAWYQASTYAFDTRPQTDAKYSTYIPFYPLSATGEAINGYEKPLVDNPFYPDKIYMDSHGVPWKASFAWVPSATRPSVPYWQDTDGIYWYKVRVSTSASMFGSPNLIWPVRATADANFTDSITPPMKAEADGMIVTVKAFSTTPVPVCLTDRYTFESEEVWNWYPGTTRMIKGPRICEFMAKRHFIWSGNKITAVEYEFLPIGDLDD